MNGTAVREFCIIIFIPYSGKFSLVLRMIGQNTLRINFRIFKFRILAAGDCVHAQLVALSLTAVYGNASITDRNRC